MNEPIETARATSDAAAHSQQARATPAPIKRAAKKMPTKALVKVGSKSDASTAPKALTKPVVKRAAKASDAAVAPAKEKKTKMVRDSFTFPKPEYEQLAALKERALALGVPVKKGELLRCGLAMLVASTDKSFIASITALSKIKAGRPSI